METGETSQEMNNYSKATYYFEKYFSKFIENEKNDSLPFTYWVTQNFALNCDKNTHQSFGFSKSLFLKPEQYENFINKYIQHRYKNGERIVLDESITKPYFKYFVDLDIEQETDLKLNNPYDMPTDELFEKTAIKMDQIYKIMAICTQTLGDFYPEIKKIQYISPFGIHDHCGTHSWDLFPFGSNSRLFMLWTTSGIKKIFDPKTKKITNKIGIHGYAIGGIYVNRQQALTIRRLIIHRLNDPKNELKKMDWENTLDANVYGKYNDDDYPGKRDGSIRIMGALKAEKCDSQYCMNNIKEYEKEKSMGKNIKFESNCDKCERPKGNGYGKKMTDAYYRPWLVIDHKGEIRNEEMEWFLTNPEKYVKATLVRTNHNQHTKEFVLHPETPEEDEKFKSIIPKRKNSNPDNEIKKRSKYDSQEDVTKQPFAKDFIEEIRQYKEYKHLDIKNLFKIKDGERIKYKMNVKGLGEHYCFNIKSEHKSNFTIFFLNFIFNFIFIFIFFNFITINTTNKFLLYISSINNFIFGNRKIFLLYNFIFSSRKIFHHYFFIFFPCKGLWIF